MNLSVAQTLAVTLMKKHRLLDKGWTFKYDNAVKRFGVCRYRSKTIGLSRKLVLLNDKEKVKDTILHEIAHAIAGFESGHGEIWKHVCIQIGAKPERCYDTDDTNVVELKYYAKCGVCGKEHQKARLKLKNVRRSCRCQFGIDWDKKVLLNFNSRY
jgi:predicted SprT family Zn-dependent metalloprotease